MRTLLEAGRGKFGAPASHSEISISVAPVWSLRAGTDVNWVERLQDRIISQKVGLESGKNPPSCVMSIPKEKLSSLMVFSKIYHKIYTNKSPNFSTLSYFREIPQTARIPNWFQKWSGSFLSSGKVSAWAGCQMLSFRKTLRWFRWRKGINDKRGPRVRPEPGGGVGGGGGSGISPCGGTPTGVE